MRRRPIDASRKLPLIRSTKELALDDDTKVEADGVRLSKSRFDWLAAFTGEKSSFPKRQQGSLNLRNRGGHVESRKSRIHSINTRHPRCSACSRPLRRYRPATRPPSRRPTAPSSTCTSPRSCRSFCPTSSTRSGRRRREPPTDLHTRPGLPRASAVQDAVADGAARCPPLLRAQGECARGRPAVRVPLGGARRRAPH